MNIWSIQKRVFTFALKSKFHVFKVLELDKPNQISIRNFHCHKMHQTKIGQFFKSSTSSPSSSPVKGSSEDLKAKALKFSDTDESNDNVDKTIKVKMSFSNKKEREKELAELVRVKNAKKRKSKNSSEESSGQEEEESPKTKIKNQSRKNDLKKKPRRRIVIESDSEDEKMDVDEDDAKVDDAKAKKEVNGKKVKEEEEEEEEINGKDDAKKEEKEVNGKSSKKAKKEEEEIDSEEAQEEEEEEIDGKNGKNKLKEEKESNGKKAKNTKKEEKETKAKKAKKEKEEKKSNAKKSKEEKKTPGKKVKEEKKEVNGKSEKVKKEEEDEEKDVKKTPEKKGMFTSSRPFTATMGVGAAPKGWNSDYDPSKSKYHPLDDASWKRGEKVPYLALAKTLEAIEATSSRLKFIEILANYFRSVILLSPDDLLFSVYLCLNKLAPAYEGVELGVAETNIMKAIAQATGRPLDKIKSEAGTLGDLGLVAEASRSSQKTLFQPQPLIVAGVFAKLKEIAAMSGTASHAKKISMITSMLVACKFSEARYLTRSLLGKLRIGLAEQSLLQALSQATYLTPPGQDMSEWPPKIIDAGKKMSPESLKSKIEAHAYIIKSCYCECPNYDTLVKALVEVGIDGIEERCKLTPGIPPRPMLAQPTKGVADVLDRFDGIRFTCEYKYDGERAQIHLLEDGSLNVYSRNQENNTSKYPDIISRFKQCIKGDVTSCILDSEAVAWDLENKSILPFQVLSTRKRKDANEAEIKVQVCVFGFDLIYLNGKSLIKEPLFKRRELLREHFQEVEGQFLFATSVDTSSMEEVQEFLEESVKGNCEGLMVKTLDERATYELAKRSQKWLKLKKDYMDSGGDSLDLVVIGGFLGKGKRAGNYGGFLLACYDPDEEVYQTICKLGTGFTDEQLLSHTEYLKPHVIPNAKTYYRYNQQLVPDHWFDAVQVWEVKCADLSLSPVHTAGEGIVDSQRGISLRFPRFLRIRDDKNIEDATSSQQVADMYKSQEVVKNNDKKDKKDDDEDFY